MAHFAPVRESEATDKLAQTYGRIRDMLGTPEVPDPFLAYGQVPAFAQDFYMNFKKFVWTAGALDVPTKTTIALAVSSALRCTPWTEFFLRRGRELGLTEQHLADTIGVSATCVMYNVFFKFRDLSGSDRYSAMSVGLRAHTFANTSIDEKLVELINIAISDINGCKPCTAGHVDQVRKLGVSDEAILETVQCAATMASGAAFLNAAGY